MQKIYKDTFSIYISLVKFFQIFWTNCHLSLSYLAIYFTNFYHLFLLSSFLHPGVSQSGWHFALRRAVTFNKFKDSLFHSTVYSPCPMKITKLHFLEFMFLFKMTPRMKSLNTFSNIRRWKTKSLNVLGISDFKRFD